MTLFSELYLQELHRKSFANKARLSGAKDCGCFHCLSHFPAGELDYWDDVKDQTAVWLQIAPAFIVMRRLARAKSANG